MSPSSDDEDQSLLVFQPQAPLTRAQLDLAKVRRDHLRELIDHQYNQHIIGVLPHSDLDSVRRSAIELNNISNRLHAEDTEDDRSQFRQVAVRAGEILRAVSSSSPSFASTSQSSYVSSQRPSNPDRNNDRNLRIEKFDGNRLKFPHFFRIFKSKYDNNPDLDVAEKFHALYNLLDEESRELFLCLENNDEGYAKVKSLLEDKFLDDFQTRRYVSRKIANINMSSASAEIITSLKKLLKATKECFELLTYSKADDYYLNTTFRVSVTEKLPRDLYL